MPEAIGELTVMNAEEDVEKIASMVDFVFCAVDMKKEEIRALEEKYAKAECPVVSNNSNIFMVFRPIAVRPNRQDFCNFPR